MLAMTMNWKETEAFQKRGDTSMKTQKMGRAEEYVRYPFISLIALCLMVIVVLSNTECVMSDHILNALYLPTLI